MFKAIIFDMDGVIINSEPLHKKAYQSMFDEFNLEVSDKLYASFTGMATFPICEKLCEIFSLNHNPKVLVENKRKHFKRLFDKGLEINLIEGVRELIQHYYENNLILILASSASMDNINMIFKKFDLDHYFKMKISGADLKASKPHPEIFEKAVAFSGHSKVDCLVIEDSTNGILAAKAADIYCVGFDSEHSKNQDYSSADLVINSFDDIRVENLKMLL